MVPSRAEALGGPEAVASAERHARRRGRRRARSGRRKPAAPAQSWPAVSGSRLRRPRRRRQGAGRGRPASGASKGWRAAPPPGPPGPGSAPRRRPRRPRRRSPVRPRASSGSVSVGRACSRASASGTSFWSAMSWLPLSGSARDHTQPVDSPDGGIPDAVAPGAGGNGASISARCPPPPGTPPPPLLIAGATVVAADGVWSPGWLVAAGGRDPGPGPGRGAGGCTGRGERAGRRGRRPGECAAAGVHRRARPRRRRRRRHGRRSGRAAPHGPLPRHPRRDGPAADHLVGAAAGARGGRGRHRRGRPARSTAGATILGAHLEGPWINPARAGAQDPAGIRSPDVPRPAACSTSGRASVRLVALAPEMPGAGDVIGDAGREG